MRRTRSINLRRSTITRASGLRALHELFIAEQELRLVDACERDTGGKGLSHVPKMQLRRVILDPITRDALTIAER